MSPRLPLVLVASILLIGCTLPQGLLAPTTPSKARPDALTGTEPAEALNGVEFKPLDNPKFLGTDTPTNQGAAAPASAGATTGASGMSADILKGISMGGPRPTMPGAVSGNVFTSYGYGGYFGGPGMPSGSGEPMALVSITGAEAPGASGGFQAILKAVVGPMIKAWAPDARLVSSNATLDNEGAPYVEPSMPPMPYGKMPYPPGYGPEANGWRLTYTSTKRNEVLNFVVRPDKTTVVRMRYAPLELDAERVKVDSTAALAKLIAAIRDAGAKGEEERTGTDYFMGFKFDELPTYDDPYAPRVEPMYEVPERARWNVNLQTIMGKLVWELNFYTPEPYGPMPVPMPMPMPVKGEPVGTGAEPVVMPSPVVSNVNYDRSGGGMVDAATGVVIRFRRPSKMTYRMPEMGMPIKVPPMMPMATPTPAPTATP